MIAFPTECKRAQTQQATYEDSLECCPEQGDISICDFCGEVGGDCDGFYQRYTKKGFNNFSIVKNVLGTVQANLL